MEEKSVAKDVFNCFIYGVPHSIAFYVVHWRILNDFYIADKEDEYAYCKQGIDRGEYYRFITASLMHSGHQHLQNNAFSFALCCHQMIGYLDKHNYLRSSCIFWSIYFFSTFMPNIGAYLLQSSWKHFLLFYFRNQPKIIREIDLKYEGANYRDLPSVGASGAIYSLIGFSFCIYIERIMRRISYILNDEGLIEIMDENEQEFDILDYDLEETTKGENWDKMEQIEQAKTRYHAIKFINDIFWCLLYGKDIYLCCNTLYKEWQYKAQQRGGRNLLNLQGNLINDQRHFMGILSGIMLYGVYKLFLDRNNVQKDKQ